MGYLRTIYVLGVCSCFCLAKDEHVQFETTRTVYNVGDTVTLTCFVRSSWMSVSFGRNNSDLGMCYTLINGCATTAAMRDEHGNYELKHEKSHTLLVIKNVTRDDDGANFTCHWTSYTATLSFAVTDKAVTTPSMHEENMSDSSVVLVPVIVSVLVQVIVLVSAIVIVTVIVRKPVLYRRIGKGIVDYCGRRVQKHRQAPVNTDDACAGQELVQTNSQVFSDDTREVITEDNDLETSV